MLRSLVGSEMCIRDSSICDTLREEVRSGFTALREQLDAREKHLLEMVDEAEEKEKAGTLTARQESVDKCCEQLKAKTAEMKDLLAQGVFNNIAAITSEIQESEGELKALRSDIGELQIKVDAQLPTQHAKDAIERVEITAKDGTPGVWFSGNTRPASRPAAGNFTHNSMMQSGGEPMSALSTPIRSRIMPPTGSPSPAPRAIYINGLPHDTSEADLREVLGEFGEIDMVNSRHIASGGFAFVFYTTNEAAARALEKPRITIKGKMVNVLAKKQIVTSPSGTTIA
eukprot:TRINITY_DN11880_c0_g1_i5.p1 TRINITY_DN11880_c0_g1~~TRINITY_DN11880_c0_g1_i5.p1  ORF type:complete len:285 (+),score=107.67 TRINITY_DN11880_c0_g1_i5:149-1003(+)